MNKLYELNRITFIANRDGIEAAREFAIRMRHIYMDAIKSCRIKSGNNRHQMRPIYLQSAYSARYIERNFNEYFPTVS